MAVRRCAAGFFAPVGAYIEQPNPYNDGTEPASIPRKDTFFDGPEGGYDPTVMGYVTFPAPPGDPVYGQYVAGPISEAKIEQILESEQWSGFRLGRHEAGDRNLVSGTGERR